MTRVMVWILSAFYQNKLKSYIFLQIENLIYSNSKTLETLQEKLQSF
jgi:hypothetical protein